MVLKRAGTMSGDEESLGKDGKSLWPRGDGTESWGNWVKFWVELVSHLGARMCKHIGQH